MAHNPPNPWDRPHPKPTRSDDNAEALYCAVGRALSAWEMVEAALAQLFAASTGMYVEKAAYIYSRLSDNRTKQTLINAAIHFECRGDNRKIKLYNKLMDMVANFADRRNDFAHGIISPERIGGCLLMGSTHSSRGYDRDAHIIKYAYNSQQIAHYSEFFGHLQTEISRAVLEFRHNDIGTPFFQTPLSPILQPLRAAIQTKSNPESP